MARIRMPDRVFLALESATTPQHVALLATFGPPVGAEPGRYVQRLFERLRAVARSSALAKRELGELPKGSTGLYGALFTWPFVAQNVLGLGGATRPPYNVVVSNIPGSSQQMYFAGCPLETVHPLGSVCHGVGLFIAARSAGGRLNLGLVGDRSLLAPLDGTGDGLGDALGEQLALLEQALERN
ncbi:WS/DGAT domain-containing protein [Kitasatospora sp. NPDC057512]|uniref:WS/DGAT domain-containing protein n=1 Tax=Kitasatospora sp. NPDC057512 TaxID=3346154 RepID=UPI0036C45FBD